MRARSRRPAAMSLNARAATSNSRTGLPGKGGASRPPSWMARAAVARRPGDPDVHDTLGWTAFRAGRLSLAASELERAVALDAKEPSYQAHLAEVKRAIDQEARAAAEARAKAARAR